MRAVVFDLDGTLVDSAPDLHAAANRMLAGLGRAQLTLQQVTSFVGNGVAKLVERCVDATGGGTATERQAALADFRRHYDAHPATLTRPYPGVVEALERLGAAGLAMGVCTNKPQRPAEDLLAALGLGRHFGAVVGGDALPVLKPDPAPLDLCLRLIGGGPALYVGDSETDAETAARAGLPFALYAGGYRKRAVDEFDAVLVFDRFEELAAYALGAPAGP